MHDINKSLELKKFNKDASPFNFKDFKNNGGT